MALTHPESQAANVNPQRKRTLQVHQEVYSVISLFNLEFGLVILSHLVLKSHVSYT